MEQFGPYRLEELIGRGGMGEVFRAFDTRRDRFVALKRLGADLAADAYFQERFRRESRLVAQLREPHVIPIHDYGEIDGRLYIDMRLVEGRSLQELIAESGTGLPPERAVLLLGQVADALDAAHAAGLLHRDVKPSNVLVDGDFAYLVDFGLARGIGDGTVSGMSGNVLGTPDYMAPERFGEEPQDGRVDVYSLACVLWVALTGTKPFKADTVLGLMYTHVYAERPVLGHVRPDLAALDGVLLRGMARNPAERFPSCGALIAAARAALGGHPAHGPRLPTDPEGTELLGARAPSAPPSGPVPEADATVRHDGAATVRHDGGATVRHDGGPTVRHDRGTAGRVPPAPVGPPAPPPRPGPAPPDARAYGQWPGPAPPPAAPRRRRPVLIGAVVLVLALLGGAVTWALVRSGADQAVVENPQDGARPPSPTLNTVVGQIRVGGAPDGVAVSPDGKRAYVTGDAGDLSVVDLESRTVTGVLDMRAPVGVAVSPDGRSVYVCDRLDDTVSVVDPAAVPPRVVDTIKVGNEPIRLALTPDGATMYVTDRTGGTVSVVDVAQRRVVATVDVGAQPAHPTLDPATGRLFVTRPRDGGLSVLDTRTNTLLPDPPALGNTPFSIAVDGAGRGYATNLGSGTVTAFDTATGAVTATIPVGRSPIRVVLTPDGKRLYVTNGGDGTVSVVDIATSQVRTIALSAEPTDAALSADGTRLYVTGVRTGVLYVIDADAGRS